MQQNLSKAASVETPARDPWAVVLLAVFLALAACASAGTPSALPAPRQPARTEVGSDIAALLRTLPALRAHEELPEQVRETLAASMPDHGEQMMDLLVTVIMLEYALVARVAARLGEEPRTGNSSAVSKTLSTHGVPRAFFVHQAEMITSARALASAARERDDQRLVSSFASLTRSCVGCHAVYRHAHFDDEDVLPEQDHEEAPGDGVDGSPCAPGQPCSKW